MKARILLASALLTIVALPAAGQSVKLSFHAGKVDLHAENATVRAFHAAAVAAGYTDHGGPGERAIYHPGYYGAFVLDPDGHNVEVVNHNR